MEKTIVFDGNNSSGNNNFDPNLLWAMMFGGGGFGGFGGGNFIWPFFLGAMLNGGWGGFGGGNNGIDFLSAQMNNTAGRDMLMQAINGKADAAAQLANMLGCRVGEVQSGIQALSNMVAQFSNQSGIGQMQIINALERGDASTAAQMFQCCCDIKGAIKDVAIGNERGFSSIAFNQERNKCDIEKAIADQTAQVLAGQRAAEMRELQDKIDRLREENGTYKTSAMTSQIVNQAVTPLYNSLNNLQGDVDKIKCKLPETYPVQYQPFTAIPNCLAYNLLGLNPLLGLNGNNNSFF